MIGGPGRPGASVSGAERGLTPRRFDLCAYYVDAQTGRVTPVRHVASIPEQDIGLIQVMPRSTQKRHLVGGSRVQQCAALSAQLGCPIAGLRASPLRQFLKSL